MINLRHITNSDYEEIGAYVSNKRVTKFLTWNAYSKREKIIEFIEKASHCLAYPNEFLAIVFKGKVIGTVHLIYRGSGAVQFGFGICPEYWGLGLGEEIIKASLRYLKNSEWLDKVENILADTHKDNIFAQKPLIRNGFKSEGSIEGELNRERYRLKW